MRPTGLGTSAGPELERGGTAEGDPIAIGEPMRRDRRTIDPGPIGRAQVGQHEPATIGPDLGVLPTHVGVVEGDRAVGKATERDPELAENHLLAIAEVQDPAGTVGLLQPGREPDLSTAECLVGREHHLDRTHELPPLGARHVAGGIAELAYQ